MAKKPSPSLRIAPLQRVVAEPITDRAEQAALDECRRRQRPAMQASRATGGIFISHSGRDTELVRDIARRLRAAGLKPIVVLDVVSGVTERKKALRERLREADAVLILVTPAALESPWLMTELGMAEAFDRDIIPVTAGLKPRDFPAPLRSYQAVPFDRLDAAIRELSKKFAGTSDD